MDYKSLKWLTKSSSNECQDLKEDVNTIAVAFSKWIDGTCEFLISLIWQWHVSLRNSDTLWLCGSIWYATSPVNAISFVLILNTIMITKNRRVRFLATGMSWASKRCPPQGWRKWPLPASHVPGTWNHLHYLSIQEAPQQFRQLLLLHWLVYWSLSQSCKVLWELFLYWFLHN